MLLKLNKLSMNFRLLVLLRNISSYAYLFISWFANSKITLPGII